MKKINTMLATLAAFLMLSVTAANSIEFKVGASVSAMGAYANAQEKLKDSARITNEEAILATSYASGFLEVGSEELMGLSLGLAYTPEVTEMDKETRVIQPSATGDSGSQLIDADVVDLVEIYATLPVGEGAFIRAGYIEATLQTKETLATGSSYGDVDMSGTVIGAGIERGLGDMMFWRAEGAYQMWDDIEAGGSETGGSGNTNKITAEVGSVTGSLSIGVKF